MSDYRIEAATKEEWAERALKAEARVKELEAALQATCQREAEGIIRAEAKLDALKARVDGIRMALAEIRHSADQERSCDALRDLIEAERGKP